MGLSGLGALIAIGLAFLAFSPRFVTRLGLNGYRLETRVRMLTGYAFAMLLLALGFFLAGVPLDSQSSIESTIAAETIMTTPTVAVAVVGVTETAVSQPLPTLTSTISDDSSSSSSTGAFSAPPTATNILAITSENQELLATPSLTISLPTPARQVSTIPSTTDTTPTAASPSLPSVATQTATTTPLATATPTMTPTPSMTPSPTITPTPIEGETAEIDTSGSTLWIRRMPGGQPIVLVRDGDVVIPLSGHANQGGILWQEVRTVDGIRGWVQEEFLSFNEE